MGYKKSIINVHPLRTADEIEEMKWAIKRGNKGTPKPPERAERDVLLFLIGINTGLRVNNIVRLTVDDVKGNDQFQIREGKTNKKRTIHVGMVRTEIDRFTEGKHPDGYLFASQKSNGPISTTQAYRILNNAANLLGRTDIGTHTMRKTFGYHHYKKFKDVAFCRKFSTIRHRVLPDGISGSGRMKSMPR